MAVDVSGVLRDEGRQQFGYSASATVLCKTGGGGETKWDVGRSRERKSEGVELGRWIHTGAPTELPEPLFCSQWLMAQPRGINQRG